MKKGIFIMAFMMLLKPVMPVLDYIINYDYIATALCENKAKPEMHCNGKCHLMKELAKASEGEKPASDKKSLHLETEVLFCQAVPDFVLVAPVSFRSDNAFPYTNLYTHLGEGFIFHPPAFI